ncbi:hypothetical protein RND81_03G197900 [Saponaria officinalis]|uniref:SBP-type domain-containing protein n=1 Tax=Saponaria officinalis TaxID=3572 RepID=A0AAW1M9V8_SAPOF
MLGYEWTNHSSSSPPHHPQLMLSDVVDNLNQHQHHHHHRHHDHDHNNYDHNHITDHQHRQIYDDHFTTPYTFPHDNTTPHHQNHHNNNNFYQTQLFSDPRAFQGASPSMFTLDALSAPTGFTPVIPKTEPDPINRPIGLNLGGRTYFSPDDDLVSRLYRRSRPADVMANTPKCQAEGCNADLSNAKHYHRRHKVCEFHSKASTVIASGLIQRFCQQCSRFHMLAEFDNGKRSCRKRLADHNRRRRKSNQIATQDHRMASPMSSENAPTSPSPRSPKSNSGMNSTSSITVAMSPPQVSFDSSFRPRLYQ